MATRRLLATAERARKQRDLSRTELLSLWESQLTREERQDFSRLRNQSAPSPSDKKRVAGPVMTCDTAATALWLLGLPVPEAFDGKPVTCAFNFQGDQMASGAGGTTEGTSLDLY